MKIAVVGCGAVGSFYGAMLCRGGQEVHFLLRSDYDVARRNGVRICSYQGDFTVRPACANRPGDIGVSDLVLIGLKTTANDQLPGLLSALVRPQTIVLTLQNGLGNIEQLARLFPAGQIMGGLCFVCLNRLEPGVIHHIGYGQVVLGEFQRPPEPRTHAIASMFREATVPCEVTRNLAQAHWEKLVWNIPFNGLGVAGTVGYEHVCRPESDIQSWKPQQPVLTTDKLLNDPRWADLVRELMLEVITAAKALGFNIPDDVADKNITRTRTMGAYKASTLLDFERGQPVELNSLFLEPLRQARQAGAPTPRLESLCRVLCALKPGLTVSSPSDSPV